MLDLTEEPLATALSQDRSVLALFAADVFAFVLEWHLAFVYEE